MSDQKIPSVFSQETRDIRQFSDSEARMFMGLSMLPPDHALTKAYPATELEAVIKPDPDRELPFQLAVLVKRLAGMTPTTEYVPAVVLMLATIAPNVGSVVMLAYSLFRETQRQGRAVTCADLGMEIMPFGVPSDDRYEQVWHIQKGMNGAGDNYIDTAEAWA